MQAFCFDIGNTRIKLGIFRDGKLVEVIYYNHSEVNEILKYCETRPFQGVILSSTAVIPQELITYFESKESPFIILNADTPIPIWNNYATPKTLGKDRLAGAVAAYHLNPESPSLIIDAGTCITFDFIDELNIFQGGNISPGLRMRYKSMHEYTAKLPLVEPPEMFQLTSNSTEEAIKSGGLLGLICEIEGLIERFNKKFRKISVFLTGGDAKILAKHIQNEIFVVPNLILNGLHTILQYNISNE